MILLNFFTATDLPKKAVRKDKAFVNESVPNVFAFLARTTKEKSRRPDKRLWHGLKPRPMHLWTYPVVDTKAWFTYKKTDNGKVRRVTLAEYLKERGKQ